MRIYAIPLVLLIVLTVPGVAKAQEKGQVGVTFASPASVGLLFHSTESFAVRPDFTFSRTSNDSTGTSGSVNSSTNTAVGIGIAALFYARTWEHLKVYVSPRFSYARSSGHGNGTSPSTFSGTVTSTSESTGNTYSGSGSVGAQYALSGRFGVFAETGIVYSRLTSSGSATSTFPGGTANTSGSSGHANAWGTRAGIGAVLYF